MLDLGSPLDGPPSQTGARLRSLAEQESVLGLDDLLRRRLDSTLAARDPKFASRVRNLLGWDEARLPDGVRGDRAAQRVGTGVSPR